MFFIVRTRFVEKKIEILNRYISEKKNNMAEESVSGQLNKISLMVNDKKKYLNVLF